MKMQKNKKLVQAAAVGLSVCVLAGGGLFVWNMYGKNAEENEKQIVSDEVAEIESLNSRDNVVDLEELFEGEKSKEKEIRVMDTFSGGAAFDAVHRSG